MPYYEIVFIARQELGAKQVEELTERYAQIIRDGGGSIHKTESWGLRSLAYKIKKNRKGHYVLIEVDSPPEAVHELERNLRLSEDILRYLTVRETALSEGPSPILSRSHDNDDRYEDGGREDRREDKRESA